LFEGYTAVGQVRPFNWSIKRAPLLVGQLPAGEDEALELLFGDAGIFRIDRMTGIIGTDAVI
jgi:hypothetical protein